MPTPRPIITPSTVAKSGMVNTLLSSATEMPPMPMPNSDTPTGRPIASTEPKARIRMTMANANPRISDDGLSNSAKIWPPNSTSTPSIFGAASAIFFCSSAPRSTSMSSSSFTSA